MTSIVVLGTFNALAADLVEASGTGATNISETITFANPPASVEPIITAFYIDPATTPAWDNASAPYDFLYSGGESSTGSTGGQPLGSLIWHTLDILDSDRTTSLVVDDGGTSDAVELPTGDIGPIGLDLDEAFGDQMVRQTTTNPVAGDNITVDVFFTEGAVGNSGFEIVLTWDPNELSYVSFSATDIFTGALGIPTPGDGTIQLASVILGAGASASADAGTGGQAVFQVLDTFSGTATITLTSAKLGTTNLTIRPGAAFVVIGGQTAVKLTPAEAANFDGDPTVGFGDFLIFAGGFGGVSTDADFDSRLDLDGDGAIGFGDFLMFAAVFGQTL